MSIVKFQPPVKRGRKRKSGVSARTLGGQVRLARDKMKLTAQELGDRVGVSHATIIRTERGTSNPDRTTLIRLAQELGSSFGEKWLEPYTKTAAGIELEAGEVPVYFGEEEHRIINGLATEESRSFADQVRELTLEALMSRRLITDSVDTNVVFLADRVPNMETMDLWGVIAAGKLEEAVGNKEPVDVPDVFVKRNRPQFVLRARGNSMIDEGIHDGSLLVCDSTSAAKNGDVVVALIDGEQATVKKFYKEKTRIRLQPANKLLDPIYVDPKRLQIQGVVVGIYRQP